MKLFRWILILTALCLGLIVRLYKIDSPIADWHSHRQADTASVSREIQNDKSNFFIPKYHDLSSVQSGIDNPQGYRMVELPVYNMLCVVVSDITKIDIDLASRYVSIFLSLTSAILVFLICLSYTKSFTPSFISLLIFLFLPFNIYYSRTVLPEPAAVCFMLITLYLFPRNIIISAIFFSFAILTKPYTAILISPALLVTIILQKDKNQTTLGLIKLFLFTTISLAPFFFWRQHLANYPEGIPANNWLLNNGDTSTFPAWWRGYNLSFLNKMIAFRPHWWTWLFKERLADMILGSYGVIPLFLGIALKKHRYQIYCISIILGIILYFSFIAQGNIQHDYYQVLIIPFISILTGAGFYYLGNYVFGSRVISILACVSIASFSLFFGWDSIKGNYQINNLKIVSLGKKANEMLPKDALVIAPFQGDTTFLYQTRRKGWPIEMYNIDELLRNYPNNPIFVVSTDTNNYSNELIKKYSTIYKTEDSVIVKLSP